jgi:hypothetical protein
MNGSFSSTLMEPFAKFCRDLETSSRFLLIGPISIYCNVIFWTNEIRYSIAPAVVNSAALASGAAIDGFKNLRMMNPPMANDPDSIIEVKFFQSIYLMYLEILPPLPF